MVWVRHVVFSGSSSGEARCVDLQDSPRFLSVGGGSICLGRRLCVGCCPLQWFFKDSRMSMHTDMLEMLGLLGGGGKCAYWLCSCCGGAAWL